MKADRFQPPPQDHENLSDEQAQHLIHENERLRTIAEAQANSKDLAVHAANLFGKNEITVQSDEDAIAALENMIDIKSKSPREIEARRQRTERIKEKKPTYWHQ